MFRPRLISLSPTSLFSLSSLLVRQSQLRPARLQLLAHLGQLFRVLLCRPCKLRTVLAAFGFQRRRRRLLEI